MNLFHRDCHSSSYTLNVQYTPKLYQRPQWNSTRPSQTLFHKTEKFEIRGSWKGIKRNIVWVMSNVYICVPFSISVFHGGLLCSEQSRLFSLFPRMSDVNAVENLSNKDIVLEVSCDVENSRNLRINYRYSASRPWRTDFESTDSVILYPLCCILCIYLVYPHKQQTLSYLRNICIQ